MTQNGKGVVSLLAVLLLLLVSAAAPTAALASSTTAQTGMVGVPDSNVMEDLPADANVSISAADLRGSVMASSHAETLEIVLTTPARSSEYVNGSEVGSGSDGLALVFKDDQHHEGRRVAVPAEAIRESVGHIPQVVYGVHESGETWSEPIRAESGLLTFRIPEFSSNSVYFTGTVEIDANPAQDGFTTHYDVGNPDSVGGFTANVTGATASESDDETGSIQLEGSSSVSVGGNVEPTGPSMNDKPVLEVTGKRPKTNDESTGEMTSTGTYPVELDVSMVSQVSQVCLNNQGWAYESTITDTDNGNTIGSMSSDGQSIYTTCYDYSKDLSGRSSWTINFNLNQLNDNHAYSRITVKGQGPSSVSVSSDTGQSWTIGDLSGGETVSREFAVTRNTTSLSWSGSGTVDYTLRLQEHTKTENVTLGVNGNEVTHQGVLEDGETAALNVDPAWIQNGNNTVTLSVGTGSLSADAPTPQAILDYQHDAEVSYQQEYAANGWLETYNVSHTYPGSQVDPTARISFDRHVYDLQQLQINPNGEGWTDVPAEDYTLEGTELTVQLDDGDGDGDVEAGDEIALRATGRKVNPVNGEITILEATEPSDNGLDTEFRIDSRQMGFHLKVGTTKNGDEIHRTYQESWDGPEEYALVTADGSQKLYLPKAQAGDTARVSTIPLVALPQTGDVRIHVADPDGPTFQVRSGSSVGDAVLFRYYGATGGETYELYSITRERPMDKATAGGMFVELDEDDSGETFKIRIAEGGSGGDDGGSIQRQVGGIWDQSTSASPSLSQYGLIVVWALLVVLLTYGTGKAGITGTTRWILVGSVLLGGGLMALEMLNPGSISAQIGAGISEIVPLAGLAAVGITVYSVYTWWQTRQTEASTPDTSVTFDLSGGKR